MNKKAKQIRQALRAQGIDPSQKTYNKKLPYVSSWTEVLPGTEVRVRKTDVPFVLKDCGRKMFKTIKKSYKKNMASNRNVA